MERNLIMKYTEIFKLKKMLEENNIPFEFIYYSERDDYQICIPSFYPIKEMVISIIQGGHSYGGIDDLLEIRGLLTKDEEECDTIAGWLTAENVFARIKKHFDDDRGEED